MTRQWTAWAAVVVAGVAATVLAAPVKYDWRPGQGVPGVDGTVEACITWDPDGAGPLPEWLVVGGQFRVAGDVVANNIAAWDGQRWHALGEGLGEGNYGWVSSLAVYNGQLVAGGEFYCSGDAGCSNIARFNGTAWESVGDGLDGGVFSLAVYDGQLVAGGSYFDFYDGVTGQYLTSSGIAGWDGQQWRPFGAAWPGSRWPDFGKMIVYRGQLVVGGDFGPDAGAFCCIARWDGQAWQSLGDGLDDGHWEQWIADLTIYDGNLIVVKEDDWSDDIAGVQQSGTVASWDGAAWEVLCQDDVFIPESVTVYNGQLVCSANDYSCGNSRVATWDGTGWQPLPGDVGGPMCVYEGNLIAGGGIVTADTSTVGISRWDGRAWRSLGEGMNWHALCVGTYRGDLVLGAVFDDAEWAPYNQILRWDGLAWLPMGEKVTTPGAQDGSATLVGPACEYQGGLVVTGWFAYAGDVVCNGIAIWDGQQWQSLGGGVTASSGIAGVSSAIVFNGDLVVGGNFDSAGGVACNAVARWDGHEWHAMDAGLTSICFTDWQTGRVGHYGPSVNVLAMYDGELYAGGTFTTTGEPVCSNIARWDGQRWQPLGAGVIYPEWSEVGSLAEYDGQLVVSGWFSQAGDVSCDSLAAWDGQQWHALSGSLPPPVEGEHPWKPDYVGPLAVYDGRLIVGGEFIRILPDPVPPFPTNVNAWDGVKWESLDSGTDDEVGGLLPYDGDLVVTGSFAVAGGKVSNQIAWWGPAYPGDLNADGCVDVIDLLILIDSTGKSAGQAGYDPACDLNGDGTVDAVDLMALIQDWGK